MNVTHNISATSPAQNTAATQSPAASGGNAQGGAGTALDQLLAFLNLLTGQGDAAAAVNGAANNAAGAGDTGVNSGTAAEIDSQKSGRSLTADLSAATVSGTQGNADDSPDLVSQLASKYDALAASGPVSDDALAQFRDNAIGFLKSKGLDESKIDKTLVDLSAMLGDKLSTSQAAQLALPAFSWTVAPNLQNNTASLATDDTGSLSVSANAKGGDAKAPAQPPAQSLPPSGQTAGASQGHDKGTSQNAPDGAATPSAGHASGKAPSTNTRGADASQQVDAGSGNTPGANSDGKTSGIINTTNGNNTAPSSPQTPNANSFAAAPADGFDGGDGSSGRNFSSGQQSSGGDTGQNSGMSGVPLQQASLQNGGPAPAQNFVNYLSSAPQGPSSAMTQMVALQIKHNAAAGTDTFSMQLEPAELGRLDIKLKFDKTGSVTAHVSADKPETLALLQKDAPQLHRLLQQAGLTADQNSLSFDLRQQGQQNSGGSGQGNNSFPASGVDTGTKDAPIQAKLAVASQGYISQSGVNIIV